MKETIEQSAREKQALAQKVTSLEEELRNFMVRSLPLLHPPAFSPPPHLPSAPSLLYYSKLEIQSNRSYFGPNIFLLFEYLGGGTSSFVSHKTLIFWQLFVSKLDTFNYKKEIKRS